MQSVTATSSLHSFHLSYLEFVWLQNNQGYVLLSQPRLPLLAVYHMGVWICDSCQLVKWLLCLSEFQIICIVPTSVIWLIVFFNCFEFVPASVIWPIVFFLTALHFVHPHFYNWQSEQEFFLLAPYFLFLFVCGSVTWCLFMSVVFIYSRIYYMQFIHWIHHLMSIVFYLKWNQIKINFDVFLVHKVKNVNFPDMIRKKKKPD